ncbi:MAG TPA: peptidoglycan-binding protein [Deltaproteobacteria bacterium]|nr:peptidoglycan-binding protein [Deltaproteobacteria bacterium]
MSFANARNFFVARLNNEAPNHNQLVGRTVQVFLQTVPGLPGTANVGIEKLDYKVFWGDEEKQSGKTSNRKDGKINVMVSPQAGTQTILEVMGTRYEIVRLQNLARNNTIRGMQQRLTLLGYYYGPLVADETEINLQTHQKDLYVNPNKETEQAILDFQADHDLFPDAMYGPKTSKAVEDQLRKIGSVGVASPGKTSDYERRKGAIGGHTKLKKLVHKSLRIVPVRFARAPDANNADADDGPIDAHAPDPDDRGFKKCIQTSYGAAVLPVGFDPDLPTQAETRVRLQRINSADEADLYVTSSSAQTVEITSPRQQEDHDGTAVVKNKLPATNNAIIKFRALKAGRCFLEVRFGAQDGPIIHRLQVVINRLRTIQVKAHAPIINGSHTVTLAGAPAPVEAQTQFKTRDQIVARFVDVNKVYFPHGIKFNVMNAVDTDVHNFYVRGCVDVTWRWNPAGAGAWESEDNTLDNHNREGNGAINVVFVRQIIELTQDRTGFTTGTNQIGGMASSARTNPNTFTVYLADWAGEAQTIAHELGHVLHLVNDPGAVQFVHVNARDRRNNPQVPGTGVNIRDDIVSRRRLMWAYTGLPNRSLREFPAIGVANTAPAYNYENIMAYRANVGYTNGKVGVMLTVKNFTKDRTDREMQDVQKTADRLIALAGP